MCIRDSNVFPLFRDYVTTTLEDVDKEIALTDIARDIHDNGQTFRKLEETNGYTPDEQTFLYRWKTLEARVATPLLLELFSVNASFLVKEKRLRTLRALESFLVRRTICRMTTKDYNRLIQELLSKLAGKITQADEVVIDFLGSQTADSREWPGYEKVIQAMLDLPLYRLLTRGRLRMVLEGLEEAMRTDKAEKPNVHRGYLTIEHILPQEWRVNWPIDLPDDPERYHRQIDTRERLKHTIGNLTLVTGKLNPLLSNAPWKDKQVGLQDHSTLFINKNLLKKWGAKSFGEEEIQERGKELAKLALKVWPGPSMF